MEEAAAGLISLVLEGAGEAVVVEEEVGELQLEFLTMAHLALRGKRKKTKQTELTEMSPFEADKP